MRIKSSDKRARMTSKVALVAVAVAAAAFVCVDSASPSRGAPGTGDLQAQLDALQPGETLKLEPRVYSHSGVLKLRVPGVHIDGNGATFQATNDETSAVQIVADGVQLSDLTLTAPAGGKRWSGLDQHKLVLSGAQDSVTHVSIAGSAAAGIFVDGASGFKISDVNVTGTRADGIHMTGGSNHGTVDDVRTNQTGDDGVAVVSYAADAAPCSDIQLNRVDVGGTTWGRGISVVGGRNVAIAGFSVANTSAAGVYVATEGGYDTDSVDTVTISDGTVNGVNHDPDVVQGAILVYSGNPGKHVSGVQISRVSIAGTSETATRNVGLITDGGSVDGISLTDISIRDSQLPAFFTDAPAGSFSTSGWALQGSPITAN
jgi:Right handed beta helix region